MTAVVGYAVSGPGFGKLFVGREFAEAFASQNGLQVRTLVECTDNRPQGRVEIKHDGFVGDIIGHYVTREGKPGVVVQQEGTRVVHVYGEKWL